MSTQSQSSDSSNFPDLPIDLSHYSCSTLSNWQRETIESLLLNVLKRKGGKFMPIKEKVKSEDAGSAPSEGNPVAKSPKPRKKGFKWTNALYKSILRPILKSLQTVDENGNNVIDLDMVYDKLMQDEKFATLQRQPFKTWYMNRLVSAKRQGLDSSAPDRTPEEISKFIPLVVKKRETFDLLSED